MISMVAKIYQISQSMRAGLLAILIASMASLTAMGQIVQTTSAVPTTSLAPLHDGWEQIDERLVFLTVRLSSDETSLQAVNKAIKQTGYQQSVKGSDADAFRHSNEIMDRKGGGPKPWDEFYGRTAEKFFYHPLDPNTAYINPAPISQRPPQLDYIYRANTDEQKRAEDEAAALGGKIDKLLDRRRQLEAEQSALWCEIAFQAIASRDLSMKPLYRFDLKTSDTDPAAAEHLEGVRAACDFVRSINQLMSDAHRTVEANQEQVFGRLPDAVDAARKAMIDRLSQESSLTLDLGEPDTRIGKVAACAKRLDDLATNILDSYRLAGDGDKAGDDQRKDTFRGMLQDQLLSSAETLFTMDQCLLDLARDWKLTPDAKSLAPEPSAHLSVITVKGDQPAPGSAATEPSQGKSTLFDDPTQQPGKVQTEPGPGEQKAREGAASPPSVSDTPAAAEKSPAASGGFLGRWQIGDSEDLPFVIAVLPNGTATKSNSPQTEGTWAYENNEIRIAWGDGWHDVLRRQGADVIKSTYQPGASFNSPPSNTSAVSKLPAGNAVSENTPTASAKPEVDNPKLPGNAGGNDSALKTGANEAGAGSDAAGNELGGEQTEPALVLSPRRQPYVLTADYVVPKGKRLEIQAGVIIVCPSRSQITVHGALICTGTKEHPIIFCGAQHSPAWWKGLTVGGAADTSFTNTQFMDAEAGVQISGSIPTFDSCIFVNNRIGVSIGQVGYGYDTGKKGAILQNSVCSFNEKAGIHVHGGSVTLNSSTVTKNGGWGVDGAYYVHVNIKDSIVSLNKGGGIILTVYDSTVNAQNSVLSGNKGFDLKNESTPEWDLRGNYWGPSLTKYFQAGGTKPPDIKGAMRFEEFLESMPKQCGSSIRDINGHDLW